MPPSLARCDGKVCDVIRTPRLHSRSLLALVAVAAIGLAACGDDTTVGSAATVADTAPVETNGTTTPVAPTGDYGTGECAPVDGSATKTQTFAAAPQKC